MNHELKNARTARDAIAKFFSGRYPEMVKNPVLLLNYLYQHSYISRPSYPLIFERKNPPYFIVSCVVDEVRTHGTGSSKKEAKTHSAKLMLNLIQNSEDSPSNTDVESCEEELVDSNFEYSQCEDSLLMQQPSIDSNLEILYSQCGDTLSMQQPSIDSDIEILYSQMMNESMQEPAKHLSFDPTDDIVQPQWDNIETVVPQSLKRSYSCTKGNKDYSMVNYESKKGIKFESTNGENMSLEDYFDPYYHLRNPSSQSSVSSTNSDAENIKPSENSSEISSDDAAKPRSKTKSKNNRSKKETKRAKLSSLSTSYVFDSYFDPFFKLKPPVVSYVDRNSSRTCVTDTKVNEVREEPDLNKSEKASTPDTELPKIEKMKSPFAILQEKSIKNFKLIPRCTIEKDGEGFKCKLILDSFSSEGTGQSKKLAKIDAALSLLSQLEERS